MTSARSRLSRMADFLFLGLVLAGTGTGFLLAATTEDLQRGEFIYRERCLECHGVAGKGDGIKAPFLSPRPGSLVSAATSAKSDSELLRIIAKGKKHTAMPSWDGILSADDQAAVLQYIRSLVRFTPPLTPSPSTP